MQVKAALKAFRGQASSPLQLIDVMVSVLRVPGRHHLLPGFEQLLSSSQRKWLRKCLQCALAGPFWIATSQC